MSGGTGFPRIVDPGFQSFERVSSEASRCCVAGPKLVASCLMYISSSRPSESATFFAPNTSSCCGLESIDLGNEKFCFRVNHTEKYFLKSWKSFFSLNRQRAQYAFAVVLFVKKGQAAESATLCPHWCTLGLSRSTSVPWPCSTVGDGSRSWVSIGTAVFARPQIQFFFV